MIPDSVCDLMDNDGAEFPQRREAQNTTWSTDYQRSEGDDDGNWTPTPIAGWTFHEVVTRSRKNLTVLAEAAMTITDADAGEYTMTFPVEQTGLPAGDYVIWHWEEDLDGAFRPLGSGVLSVSTHPETDTGS